MKSGTIDEGLKNENTTFFFFKKYTLSFFGGRGKFSSSVCNYEFLINRLIHTQKYRYIHVSRWTKVNLNSNWTNPLHRP